MSNSSSLLVFLAHEFYRSNFKWNAVFCIEKGDVETSDNFIGVRINSTKSDTTPRRQVNDDVDTLA